MGWEGRKGQGKSYLSDEAEDVEGETDVRAVHATEGAERDLVQGVALLEPRGAEADVGQADGAPSEKGGETRQGEQPVKDGRALSVEVNIRQRGEGTDGEDRDERAAGAVNVGEDPGGVALLGERGERAGAAVDGRHTDGQDRDQDDDVHERVVAVEVGVLAHKHERRGGDIGIRVTGAQKARVVVRDQEADEEQTQDVEEGDTPEDLLDGTRERPQGVLGLSCGETDELGSGEGKGGRDEDGAETAEAVSERTRLIPGTRANIFVIATAGGATTEDQHEGNDHEDDDRSQLQHRRPELFFGVTEGAEDVDDENGDEEDGDPNS